MKHTGGRMEDNFYSKFPSFVNAETFSRLNKPQPKKVVTNKPGRPLPKQRPVRQVADMTSKSPMLKKIMKAKELDTKIRMMRKEGKAPRDFVDLLDEFQKNSMDLENDN
jgi:hypothetical protein